MKSRQPFDPYEGRDPREIPAYGIAEAAHNLSIPDNAVRSWVSGRSFPAKTGRRRSPALVKPANLRSPTADVFERFKAGDSLETLVVEYGRSTEAIQEAIRYEADRAA